MRILLLYFFVISLLIFPVSIASATSDGVNVKQDANLSGVPSGGNQSGSVAGALSFIEFSTAAQDSYVFFSWKTNRATHYILSWGLTPDLELGTATSANNITPSNFLLENLNSNTKYFYKLIVIDAFNNQTSHEGNFNTTTTLDSSPPANVLNFTATPKSNHIALAWTQPLDLDLAGIRVVRSDKFYPLDSTNGLLIYQGRDSIFDDYKVTPGVTYFYTIFSFDNSGNYSSGAIAEVVVFQSKQDPNLGVDNKNQNRGLYDPTGLPIIDKPIVDITIKPSLQNGPKLNSGDFIFTTRSNSEEQNYRNLSVGSNDRLVVTIAKKDLPEPVKSLIATLSHSEDLITQSRFLFFYDQNTQSYQLELPELSPAKNYTLEIGLLDGEYKLYQDLNYNFDVFSSQSQNNFEEEKISRPLNIFFWSFLILIPTIMLLSFFFKIRKRN